MTALEHVAGEPLDLLTHYLPGSPVLVRAGMVLSADGATESGGTSRAFTGAGDRAVFRLLRALCDVVLVGAGTARTEGYRPVELPGPLREWRVRHGLPPAPRLAVVSRSGDVPRSATDPVLLVAPSTVLETADLTGTEPLAAGSDAVDLTAALTGLRALGLRHVLCEGGPELLGDLVRAGVVDEICMTVAPLLVGPSGGLVAGALDTPARLRLEHALAYGDELLLRYTVLQPRC